MLTLDDLRRFLKGEATVRAAVSPPDVARPRIGPPAKLTPPAGAATSGAPQTGEFARRLMTIAGFGDSTPWGRDKVLLGLDAGEVAVLPPRVDVFPRSAARPFNLVVIESTAPASSQLGRSLFKKLQGENDLESALERICQAALKGFAHGVGKAFLQTRAVGTPGGAQTDTVVVASIRDDRFDDEIDAEKRTPVHLMMFATRIGSDEEIKAGDGLETFVVRQECARWEPQLFEEYTERVYKRHFERLARPEWREAFVIEEERKKARALLKAATNPREQLRLLGSASNFEKKLQEACVALMEEVARGFGLRAKQGRVLECLDLPKAHDIAADAAARDRGEPNPLPGIIVRDQSSRLLGYIVYCLDSRVAVEVLRERLQKDNCFHNVLVIFPDLAGPQFELWQGSDRLDGMLVKRGARLLPEAALVSLLTRFFVVGRNRLGDPKELAEQLAKRARFLRRLAKRQLDEESAENLPEHRQLTTLYEAFKTGLIHGMSPKDFADAYAQTMAYGLLSARWISKDQLRDAALRTRKAGESVPQFTRAYAQEHLNSTSPFLQALFEKVLSDKFEPKLAWLLDDIAALLNQVDVAAVFRQGGSPEQDWYDPIYYFYEPFLEAYDHDLKIDLGVFYTPLPVVEFMVAKTDQELRDTFGLVDGLASCDTWQQVSDRCAGVSVPTGTSPQATFVSILDPATGTGTFLVAVIDHIYTTLCRNWADAGKDEGARRLAWQGWVDQHLLPRLNAMEVMVAPYAIAHLKLALKLAETGYVLRAGQTANIVLANSLEPSEVATDTLPFGAIVTEIRSANALKSSSSITVVLGNPPYANYSSNLSETCRRIVDIYRTFQGVPIRERNQLQFERNIQDDCVKFIALGDRLIATGSGVGVLTLITNASVLVSPSLRGMRERLIGEYAVNKAWHLHGASSERAPAGDLDQNVFPIDKAVAVHLHARLPGMVGQPAVCGELWGSRDGKFQALRRADIRLWPVSDDPGNNPLFTSCPTDGQESSAPAWKRLDETFAVFGAGIKTGMDGVAIGFSSQEVTDQVQAHLGRNLTAGEQGRVHRVLYRPFDVRYIFYHEAVISSRSWPTMKHMLAGKNVALVSNRSWTSPSLFGAFVADGLVEMKAGTHDRGTTIFPCYRYQEPLASAPVRSDNIVISSLVDALTATKYLYAICYSPTYRERYSAFLSAGFPFVPQPKAAELCASLAKLGGELIALHLMEPAALGGLVLPATTATPGAKVERRTWSNGVVGIGASSFSPVSAPVWNFQIGGYQVCDKWLKDRKGRTLTADDILHYRCMIAALGETMRIMAEIDVVIEKHGGWPGAFAEKP